MNTITPQNTNHHGQAITYMLLGCLCNALMMATVKYLSQALPLNILLCTRFFISFVCIALFIKIQKPKKKSLYKGFFYKKNLLLQTTRSIIGFLSLLLFFYATKHLSLASATVLASTTPFYIPFLTSITFKKSLPKKLWPSIGLGFAGVLLILNPGSDVFSWYAIMGLLSGIGAAIVILLTRILSYTDTVERTIFIDFLMGTCISLLLCLNQQSIPITHLHQWYLLVAIGLLGFGYLGFNVVATHKAPVRLSAPFLYFTTVFSVGLDWLIWQHQPVMSTLAGIILIMVAGTVMLLLFPDQNQ